MNIKELETRLLAAKEEFERSYPEVNLISLTPHQSSGHAGYIAEFKLSPDVAEIPPKLLLSLTRINNLDFNRRYVKGFIGAYSFDANTDSILRVSTCKLID